MTASEELAIATAVGAFFMCRWYGRLSQARWRSDAQLAADAPREKPGSAERTVIFSVYLTRLRRKPMKMSGYTAGAGAIALLVLGPNAIAQQNPTPGQPGSRTGPAAGTTELTAISGQLAQWSACYISLWLAKRDKYSQITVAPAKDVISATS
jgi:hypothetical protein